MDWVHSRLDLWFSFLVCMSSWLPLEHFLRVFFFLSLYCSISFSLSLSPVKRSKSRKLTALQTDFEVELGLTVWVCSRKRIVKWLNYDCPLPHVLAPSLPFFFFIPSQGNQGNEASQKPTGLWLLNRLILNHLADKRRERSGRAFYLIHATVGKCGGEWVIFFPFFIAERPHDLWWSFGRSVMVNVRRQFGDVQFVVEWDGICVYVCVSVWRCSALVTRDWILFWFGKVIVIGISCRKKGQRQRINQCIKCVERVRFMFVLN